MVRQNEYWIESCIEYIVDEIADNLVNEKDVKRHYAKGFMYENEGQCFFTGYKKSLKTVAATQGTTADELRNRMVKEVMARNPGAKILVPNKNANCVEVYDA